MGDITKNFSYYEFKPRTESKSWVPESEYQKILLVNLAENLQVIRNNVPRNSYMRVSSGVRNKNDFDRLTSLGYHPSKTSDHNFGLSVELDENSLKYKKFGRTYNFSVGASDIIAVGMKTWDLFKLSFQLTKEGMCDFGQIIYEKDPNSNAEWIHYGNNPSLFFSEKIVHLINRSKFLKSLNGGRGYSVVDGI